MSVKVPEINMIKMELTPTKLLDCFLIIGRHKLNPYLFTPLISLSDEVEENQVWKSKPMQLIKCS